MARTTVATYTLIDLFHLMRTGRLAVPSFQRGYVWGLEQVRRLFISINVGHPVGTLIAVELQDDHLAECPPELSLFPASERGPGERNRLWIVDGVQRLGALYNSLFTARESFTIYYDLRERQFCLPSKSDGDKPVLKMSSLLNPKELMSLQSSLRRVQDAEAQLAELNSIRERFYSYAIPLLTMSDLKDVELVEIFEAINTAGRSLTNEEVAHARSQVLPKDHRP
jgi:uncharacterized protein with ParB-like and HNH nuclease domain